MVRFNLKDKKSEEPTLIYLHFYYEKNTFKKTTGLKILPKYWDSTKQRVKRKREFRSYQEYNHLLDGLESKVNEAYYKLKGRDETVNNESLFIEAFTEYDRNKIDFYTYFNSRYKRIVRERGNERAKQYKNALERCKDYRSGKPKFKDINTKFYHGFIEFMNDKGFAPNYQGAIIKRIKEIMGRAYKEELHSSVDWKSFKVITEETDHIYLTSHEIDLIIKKEVSNEFQLAKDILLICCFTGLRYGDVQRISPANIGDEYLKIRASKDDEMLTIPLKPMVHNILKKHDFRVPRLSQQKFNEKIKKVCEKAEIDEKIEIKRTKGRNKEWQEFYKWEKVSSHTGRRSFCTNLWLERLDPINIIKMTGHSTVKQLLSYIKVDSHQNAEIVKKHSFFQ